MATPGRVLGADALTVLRTSARMANALLRGESVGRAPRVYIFDAQEISLLLGVISVLAVFSFTLGLHFGKQIHSGAELLPVEIAVHPASTIPTLADQAPTPESLDANAPDNERTSARILDEDLAAEVKRTGLKLREPRIMDLPHRPKKTPAGATRLNSPPD